MTGRTWIHGIVMACALCLLAGPTNHGRSADLANDLAAFTNPSKADKLAKEASDILAVGEIDDWSKAAKLLERAAFLRDDSDEAKPANLKLAGTLFCAVGLREHARGLIEQAAGLALDQGDLVNAAHTFLDAAALSAQLRMGRHTINAAREARRIAAAPGVAEADRAAILDRAERLGAPTALAQIM
jgi:hypothetical protein